MNRYEPTLYVRPHIDPRKPSDRERFEQRMSELPLIRATARRLHEARKARGALVFGRAA